MEFGLQLACASSDGKVSILKYIVEEGVWHTSEWAAHQIGCNAVSWSPSAKPSSLLVDEEDERAVSSLSTIPSSTSASLFSEPFLVTGGCDNLVKIWR